MVLALLSTFMPAASALTLGGYTFTTSVGDTWATLDLQLASMSNASRAQDWSATLAAYEDTATSPGVSLASLLPTVNSNGPSHPLASATAAYWSDALHGDALVRAAIGGTGEVANWDASSRREILTKAAAYEVVLYTASLNKYADPLIDMLDPAKARARLAHLSRGVVRDA